MSLCLIRFHLLYSVFISFLSLIPQKLLPANIWTDWTDGSFWWRWFEIFPCFVKILWPQSLVMGNSSRFDIWATKNCLFRLKLLRCTLLYQLQQFSYFPSLILFMYLWNEAKRRDATFKQCNLVGSVQNGQAQVG